MNPAALDVVLSRALERCGADERLRGEVLRSAALSLSMRVAADLLSSALKREWSVCYNDVLRFHQEDCEPDLAAERLLLDEGWHVDP